MQYQIPTPRPLIKQAPSKGPVRFNEPTIFFDPTAWLNRNVLYYPTKTNPKPIPKFIEPRIDFDLTGWMDRTVQEIISPKVPTLVPFIPPTILFDPTGWMNRNTLYYPTITNKAFQNLFIQPTVYFDAQMWLSYNVLVRITPTAAGVTLKPLRMRTGMGQ